ncbi:MAG: hypothetical protein K2X91_14165 [Thermoleophilia bacterium]|nr:hypothetical protein [Thermoleophilia bacterium]
MGQNTNTARLVALVAALLIVVPAARAAAASLEQLIAIDQMLSNRDWGALWAYLVANPALTQGDDPLSSELRAFMSAMNLGTMDEFAARPFVTERGGAPY